MIVERRILLCYLLNMVFRKFLTEEQVGFAIGYTAAFMVDNFVKVSAVK